MNTSTTWTNTVWYTITKNASNTIEIDWQAATTPSGNNGLLTFWVNGVQRDNKTGLRNGNRAVDTVQWGMVTGRDTGTSGAFYLDGFVSRRATYIGSQSTGQMAVGPAFDLAAKSYYRPVRLDGLKDRAAAGLAAPLADISGTVLVTTTIGYQYDGLGRLIAARYSDGRFFEYTYDSTGNRLSETKPTGAVTYTYDVANRLLTAGAQAYVWDAAGNLITDGAITYTYDSAQRLIGLDSPGSTSSYVYNGLGDRVQQSVNGATTNYALDLNTGLTQVLADNGTVYLYGADRLGERQAGGWQYHHADGLGSLRTLTNGSATVTLSKRYAPYGDVLDAAGTGTSVFGFTGEQQDNYIKLVYLRARYYGTETGRFVSRDTYAGDYSRPGTQNRWSYVENNPSNLTDPTGNCPTCYIFYFWGVGAISDDESAIARTSPNEGTFISALRAKTGANVIPVYPYDPGSTDPAIDAFSQVLGPDWYPGSAYRLYIKNLLYGTGANGFGTTSLSDAKADEVAQRVGAPCELSKGQSGRKTSAVDFLAFSGGGQIAYSTAQSLSGTLKIRNLVTLGSPLVPYNGSKNIGRIWRLTYGDDIARRAGAAVAFAPSFVMAPVATIGGMLTMRNKVGSINDCVVQGTGGHFGYFDTSRQNPYSGIRCEYSPASNSRGRIRGGAQQSPNEGIVNYLVNIIGIGR